MIDAKLDEQVLGLAGGREFKDAMNALSVDELKARIAQMQSDLNDSEADKEEKVMEEVKLLRGQANELLAPYNDVKKAVKIKTKYILELIKDRKGQ